MRCSVKSERHEQMMDLTVEIEGNIETLEEALRKFTATEILDGENKYHCNRLVNLFFPLKSRISVIAMPFVMFFHLLG